MLIEADFVELAKDSETVQLFLSSEHLPVRQYISLSRTLRPTSQDVRLGLDKVHIEVNDQGISGYDQVDNIDLIPGRLSVSLKPLGLVANELGVKIDIHYDQHSTDFLALKEAVAFFMSS